MFKIVSSTPVTTPSQGETAYPHIALQRLLITVTPDRKFHCRFGLVRTTESGTVLPGSLTPNFVQDLQEKLTDEGRQAFVIFMAELVALIRPVDVEKLGVTQQVLTAIETTPLPITPAVLTDRTVDEPVTTPSLFSRVVNFLTGGD